MHQTAGQHTFYSIHPLKITVWLEAIRNSITAIYPLFVKQGQTERRYGVCDTTEDWDVVLLSPCVLAVACLLRAEWWCTAQCVFDGVLMEQTHFNLVYRSPAVPPHTCTHTHTRHAAATHVSFIIQLLLTFTLLMIHRQILCAGGQRK